MVNSYYINSFDVSLGDYTIIKFMLFYHVFFDISTKSFYNLRKVLKRSNYWVKFNNSKYNLFQNEISLKKIKKLKQIVKTRI